MPKRRRTDWLDRLADRSFRALIWAMRRLPWRTRIGVMAGPSFTEMVNNEPTLSLRVMRILAERIRALNTRLAEHSFLNSKCRLYAELLRLSQPRSGHSGQRVISPPPFQHDLANRIGCRREVVSREIASLRRENIVETNKGALVLVNPGELNERISKAMCD